ncbi:putative Chase2 sensor protein [Cylindrospermum sp. NIES-4074]|nr:putative Chase2 sensor protein [Cylindrospermum sp. NIES-4074]
MGKLVVLKFGEGSFEQGFAVTLQIGEEREHPSTEILGKLPPSPEMPLCYGDWQSCYRRLGNGYRLYADNKQITNFSITQDCEDTARMLRKQINHWLLAEEFRPLRERWLERLSPTEEIRVIVQTENNQLQRLPWHLWDLLQRYPKAEVALSSPSYDRIHKPRTPNPSVNILAIVGDSQGINTQADQALLQQCNHADVKFVVEPKRQDLTNHLWGKNWDILFFAGHSSSQGNGETGRIYLNQTDSLTISELRYALRKAIERGLQLAIFNSCDGLGLARELADLQIPQIIVMREPVPDQVAQEFLKYFLQGFAGGETLYQAVRHAREQLQGLEDKFPCATWLPVICQNPAQIPPTWEELWGIKNIPVPPPPPKPPIRPLKAALLSSLMITTLVCGVRFLGLLQSGELKAYDQMMRSRPNEGVDPRLLVVTIDEEDLATQRRNGESLKGTSLSDKSLNKLLAKLEVYQPKAVGLDIYRDFSAEQQDLIQRLRQTQNLIGICKGSDATENIKGNTPPPEIPRENLGFSDFIHDRDDVMRRHLLYMNQEAASLCPASYAFSTQLAFRYLDSLGIRPTYTTQGNLQLGKTVFPSLKSRLGGYQIDANGQILLNYRASKQVAEQVTLTQFLSTPVSPSNSLKDRIVLIGVTVKEDARDSWSTPYGSVIGNKMPGVMVHAHMISQILSAVLDGRSLLRVWSPWVEVAWIWGWSLVGVVLVWRSRSFPVLTLAVGVTSGVLYLLCFGLLIWGTWVPFVPSALSLVATVGLITIQNLKLSKIDN